ncbi:hypothetical protein B0T09DRAFT_48576 [Sordaria sp. MPI-SDFR-AT-0083]|nr:hypothetical protein B0T09DRAFT_48576 [Sordaria sp. MPI-SDFR-AT-0083]
MFGRLAAWLSEDTAYPTMSSPTGEANSPTPGPASSTPQTEEGLLPGAHWGHQVCSAS